MLGRGVGSHRVRIVGRGGEGRRGALLRTGRSEECAELWCTGVGAVPSPYAVVHGGGEGCPSALCCGARVWGTRPSNLCGGAQG